MDQEKKIQFRNKIQIFLMIVIPYVCFSILKAGFENSSKIFDNSAIRFDISFLLILSGVTLFLMIIKEIKSKELKNTQFTNVMNAEDTSEKSPELILYRISIAGKDIKFSMIFSIIILILDIILIFTSHIVASLWGYNHTSEIIFYILISISIIIAIISIWISLKSREQEKGKNLILFGIQYLFFLVILSLTYWSDIDGVGYRMKGFEIAQSLFLVILIVSCLGIGFSLLSGSKKDQLNILFFTFYFTLGNFAFIFGYGWTFLYIKQLIIVSILCAVIGIITIKFRNSSKIKINLPTILYGLVISGSSNAISGFTGDIILFSSLDPFYFIYNGIVFIVIQVLALIQLFINSNNLKEKLSNNGNYLKMLYFIELIIIFPSWMQGWSFYTISIIILGIINFGLLFMQPKFKINIYLGALLLNLIVFIPNMLIRLFSNWTYDVQDYFVRSQQEFIVFIWILTSITLAITWFKENRDKKKNLVEK